jgi:hypothetical protein
MLVGMRFEEIAEVLAERVATLEPERYSGVDAARLAVVAARCERLSATAKMLLARRAADSGGWADASSAVSPEQWLARLSGQSEAAARDTLTTAERLDALPATAERLRAGELSPAQAAQVSAGATADPSAESRLLDVAEHEGLRELRAEKDRVVAAVSDETTGRARARRERHLRTWVDGFATRGSFSGPTEEVAEILEALRPLQREAFDAARRGGEYEPAATYRFDALVALARGAGADAHHDPATRGSDAPTRSRRDGVRIRVGLDRLLGRDCAPGEEMCEIPGVGPVPVAHAREVLSHGLLELVITDGVDVQTVVSSTRHIPTALRIAIAERDDHRCKVRGCDRRHGIEHHHTLGFAQHRLTRYNTLGVLCSRHHHLVHHRGHQIIENPDGTWRLRAPPSTSAA